MMLSFKESAKGIPFHLLHLQWNSSGEELLKSVVTQREYAHIGAEFGKMVGGL